MNKCDFCTQSGPNGECFWPTQALRESDCRKAIRQMVEALGNKNKDEKRRRL